jgi:hypothetical protein
MRADGGWLCGSVTFQGQQVRPLRLRSWRTVVMGVISKAASILTPSRVSHRSRRQSRVKAAAAQAGPAEAETKVAEEQAGAIARALHEDEAQRQADLQEVAEREAEAVPWDRHAGF